MTTHTLNIVYCAAAEHDDKLDAECDRIQKEWSNT